MTIKFTVQVNRVVAPVDAGPRSARAPGWQGACVGGRVIVRKLRPYLAALTLAGITVACNTPSVPIPPPAVGALRFQSSGTPQPGTVVLQGAPFPHHANVRFYVYNLSRGDGVITTAAADGAFTTSPFAGTEGDTVRLYFDRANGDRSADACVQLQVEATLLNGCP